MKYRDTRITTFKEDYNPQRRMSADGKTVVKEGKVLYVKGEKYAIHYKLLEQIKGRGAKFEAEKLDVQKAHDAQKARLTKQRKAAKELTA